MLASRFTYVAMFLLISLTGTWAAEGKNPTSKTTRKTVLRVALFPYIPDAARDKYAALSKRIETEFEAQQKGVDLKLMAIDPAGPDFYETANLVRWLGHTHGGEENFDLVEVDTVLLGTLKSFDVIQPWGSVDASDWLPQARASVEINDENGIPTTYGIPHLLCGHFVFARDARLATVTTVDQLVTFLDGLQTPIPNLSGTFRGSWNAPALYLDAWKDTHKEDPLGSAVTFGDLDAPILSLMATVARQCQTPAENPCLTKTYDDDKDPDKAAAAFIGRSVDATFGYSERLHHIRSASPAERFYFIPIPLGQVNTPVLFADAFVLSRHCKGACAVAARTFAAYMNSPKTQEWVLLSKDAQGGSSPRYLLPATKSAFERTAVGQDHYYQELYKQIVGAVPFPNSGLPEARHSMRERIRDAITK